MKYLLPTLLLGLLCASAYAGPRTPSARRPGDSSDTEKTVEDGPTQREKIADTVGAAIGDDTLCVCFDDGHTPTPGVLKLVVPPNKLSAPQVRCATRDSFHANGAATGYRKCERYTVIGKLGAGETVL